MLERREEYRCSFWTVDAAPPQTCPFRWPQCPTTTAAWLPRRSQSTPGPSRLPWREPARDPMVNAATVYNGLEDSCMWSCKRVRNSEKEAAVTGSWALRMMATMLMTGMFCLALAFSLFSKAEMVPRGMVRSDFQASVRTFSRTMLFLCTCNEEGHAAYFPVLRAPKKHPEIECKQQ